MTTTTPENPTQKQVLNFDLHTIVLLIGPTGSGKTHFCQNKLIPALAANGLNACYLSSDEIRRGLLGRNDNKYSPDMMQVSEKAFKKLHHDLDLAMSWPHNAHFVVVDTTGLSNEFRNKVITQAETHNYSVAAVIFDYKNSDEHLRHVPTEDVDRRLLYRHIERLRKDVWPNISKKLYSRIHKIRSKNWDLYDIEIHDLAKYNQCQLPGDKLFDVIGDVHGCLNELKNLLKKAGYTIDDSDTLHPPEGRIPVLVGDLIDKGPDSKGVLQFVHKNLQTFKIVYGNHENFVFKSLSGRLREDVPADTMQYFDSIEKYKDDKEFKDLLGAIVEASAPFYANSNLIITHAPCSHKYLGKTDRRSRKAQNRIMVPYNGTKEELEETLSFIKTEKNLNGPTHVFGHVPVSAPTSWLRHKIFLDTACVDGHKLTMFRWNGPQRKEEYISVDGYTAKDTAVPHRLFGDIDQEVSVDSLDRKDQNRIKWLCKERVNYISGTMAPAPADKERGVLESLDKALEYYSQAGVKKVVLQPKFMGSRCNVYLNKEIGKCYATSRNGYVIKRIDMKPVFEKLLAALGDSMREEKWEWLILDGELLPWHALGSGLIENTFKVVEAGIRTELEALEASGFEQVLAAGMAAMESSGFKEDAKTLNKDALYAKYGHAKGHSMNCLSKFEFQPIEEQKAGLKVYSRQLELYGKEGELTFKPFAVLKIVLENGEESVLNGENNESQYELLNKAFPNHIPSLTVDLSNADDIQNAHKYFDGIARELEMEGVVVKPAHKVGPSIAPYIKVRSETYLTIVYGYDYKKPKKYKHLIEQKNIWKKLNLSIKEWNIGQKMLSTKLSDINESNNKYVGLLAKMIDAESSEKGLDPRL